MLLLLVWPKIVGVCNSSSIDVGVDVGGVVSIGGGRWCPSISGVCHCVNEEIEDVGVSVFVGVGDANVSKFEIE